MRTQRRLDRRLLAGLAIGAGLASFLDPVRGRRRRDRTAAAAWHGARRLKRIARVAGRRTLGRSRGALHGVLRAGEGEELDDAGLAHKVESVLFRDPRVPKGRLSINAEEGAVFLRGEVESPELIDELASAVAHIRGVGEVVNLLHLPGTDAPHAEPRLRADRRPA